MQKTGRNEPCPCGSGRKYKRCHGDSASRARLDRVFGAGDLHTRRMQAQEAQRRAQQGLGRPIISAEVGGQRFVAVGNRVFFDKQSKTFPDFLIRYLRVLLGPDWGNPELGKSEADMHPIALWYRKLALNQRAHVGKPGEVFSAPDTGASRAFLELAYNLYSLQHNSELREVLIKRLKNPDQFWGVLSEIRVAGMLTRAGFRVKFHDESDSNTTHCEYDATLASSGNSLTVEVKTKHWTDFPLDDEHGHRLVKVHIGRLLRDALAKEATHERVVVIELAMPDESKSADQPTQPWWLQHAIDGIREAEKLLLEQGRPVPPAKVIVCNHPHQFHLDSPRFVVGFVSDGIGPTDFRSGVAGTIREAVEFRNRHADFLAFWDSIERYRRIPQTFDGSNLHTTLANQPPPLIVGERYQVPDADGNMVVGELEDAAVLIADKMIHGIYKTEEGKRLICGSPMSDEEVAAYEENPDTFFGAFKPVGRINDPVKLYESLLETYGKCSREQLLKFMSTHPDRESLEVLTRQKLAEIYCEGIVGEIMAGRRRASR